MRYTAILAAILVAGAVLRLVSFEANSFTHGNVGENIRAAVSFAREGTLKVAPPTEEPYWYSTAQYGGRYLDLNAPLWPVTAGAVARAWNIAPTADAMFLLFKLMSLLAGLAVIILAYIVALRLAGPHIGLFVAAVLAVSFATSDYSANGAFYMMQAALYLSWALAAMRGGRAQPYALGALSGLAWLLNYQAVVVILASGVLLLFFSEHNWRRRLRDTTLAVLVSLAVVSPLLVRNYLTFGDVFHTNKINMTYVWNKAGLAPQVNGDVKFYDLGARELLAVARGALLESLPHNAYYIARKLFVLLPIAFILFAYGALGMFFEWRSRRKLVPIFLLLFFSFLQMALWPVVQFRYFIPVIPLVLIAGAEYGWRVFAAWPRMRIGVFLASFAAAVAVSVLMFYSNPLHVCYYDCAVTTGPLGRNEELEHLRANGYINE